MAAKIINGVCYVYLTHDNELKSISFEDNLYHTLLDMWWNIEINEAFRLSHYISQLTGGIPFEKRSETFTYNNILDDNDYIKRLFEYLTNLCLYKNKLYKDGLFDFWEIEEDEEIDMNKYMKYHEWWAKFEDLFYKLENIYKSQNNL